MLTVSEVYVSIQGESTLAGRPCVFVRLTACNLRCTWCDTPYAFTGGRKVSVDDLVREIEAFGCPLIEITGGEPLLQPDAVPLMQRLVDGGWTVLLETGGQIPIGDVPDEVMTILDVKCPSSGEAASTHWPNLDQVSPRDEVKFVLGDRVDFDYACDVIERHALAGRVGAVLLSPVHGVLAPADLACWMLERGVAARLHLQVHKYIWPPDRRGV